MDGRIVADVEGDVGRQRDLRQADCARIHDVGGASDLEYRHHGVRVVEGLGTKTQVDVDKGRLVSDEPAGLEGKGAASDGPFGPVLRYGKTAA